MMYPSSSQNSLLYHTLLKDNTLSLAPEDFSFPPDVASCKPPNPFPPRPTFHWDMQKTSKPMFPAFDYISQRLAQHGLQVALIISDHGPCVIPVWPLSRKAQVRLTRIVGKACARFNVCPSWMTALASFDGNEKGLFSAFEAYSPNAYIVRRSVLQHEVVFSAEGLTLLSIDHIRTLKQLLCTLSKKDWVSNSRSVCLSSCVHLLRRINAIHTGTKFSKAYIQRVYHDTPFCDAEFDEVMTAYERTFCAPRTRSVPSSRDLSIFRPPGNLVELEDTSPVAPSLPDNLSVSPLSDVDLGAIQSWTSSETIPTMDQVSSVNVTYPRIRTPSIPPVSAQAFPSSPISGSGESWSLDAPPSPLKVVKKLMEQRRDDADDHTLHERESVAETTLSRGNLKELEEDWQMSMLEAKSKAIIESWNVGVQEAVVCSRCFDAIQQPRRFTLCY